MSDTMTPDQARKYADFQENAATCGMEPWSVQDWLQRCSVMAAMHSRGDQRELVSADLWVEAYLVADGFGQIDLAFAIKCEWDWSHVRDSSPEGVRRMAVLLSEQAVPTIYGLEHGSEVSLSVPASGLLSSPGTVAPSTSLHVKGKDDG